MSIETNKSASDALCRVLIQQCVEAELRVDETNVSTINRGIVIYVSFFKNATEAVAKKAAHVAMQLKLSETDSGNLVSARDLPADVLLIPQACLGGKKKGNSMQYHQLVNKDLGRQLFEVMKSELEEILSSSKPGCTDSEDSCCPRVVSGIYGERQILKIDCSMGPFSHVVDL